VTLSGPLAASQALPQLKQCLHYDPDSSSCKKTHRILKGLAKSVTQIDNFVAGSTWRSAVNHLVGTPSKPSVIEAFDETLASYQSSFPAALSTPAARRLSEPRRKLYSAACKALTELGETAKAQPYCDETLLMKADDVDGLVGRAEGLMKAEDWEAAVRTLEQAFAATGQSSQDVSRCADPSPSSVRL
jgi:DnaJ family protein C protein 3